MSGRTIVFYDANFPIADAGSIGEIGEISKIGEVTGADELAGVLRSPDSAVFVNLHAPYFPKSAWPDILAFLKRGGGLISIGGAPFKRPVRREDGAWRAEAEQTAYHRALRIHETLPVDAAPIRSLRASADIPWFADVEASLPIADTWNLVPHVTKSSDLPHQMGSAGPMDAVIYPLLKGISAAGREVAAPAVLWEYARGEFAGGRWLFINQQVDAGFWAGGGALALRRWAELCATGVTELSLKPNYATYWPGEQAMLTLQAQSLGRSPSLADVQSWTFNLSLRLEGREEALWDHRCTLQVTSSPQFVRIPIPYALTSGYYRIVCEAVSESGETRLLRQGFWGWDAGLLAEGAPISAGRDYFEKDGRPLPVVGMTYMASDVARKYLFLPNADVWDRDMAQMSKAGINWIRTGLWTAYRNIMQVDGHASEEALRAIDAFLLTAKRHGLQVTFTFFSFTPETWEGVNPYLDPRSVEAQKRFVRSIVSRHKATTNVDWDLINEPSMFDPARIFSSGPRSSRDPFERQAFSEWLEARHGTIEALQERWNYTPDQLPDFAAATPPEPEEINFDVQDMHSGKNGTRWLDYVLFSMEMHNRWARQLVQTIKEACPQHLVTVGQDEALGAQRPSPFFYGEAVDYTTIHPWWLNDDLLWSGVFAKTPDKPNLSQETGIMYVETPDGRAKRSETELRNMLERKYAYAFATGGAGAMQWIWNTNFYMDNANESHIGALRADGTEKPEADVSYDFGRFIAQTRDLFHGRQLEDVAVVFPYSNDFSNRSLAYDATTRLTRVLAYELHVPFRGVGEYQLQELEKNPPKLVILPSAHNVDDTAFDRLIEFVRKSGATLLFTGPIHLDAYWRKVERLTDLLGTQATGNVLREERLRLGDREYPVSFGQRRIAEASKSVPVSAAAGSPVAVVEAAIGAGRLIWSPLPVELNERIEPVAQLYRHALQAAGVRAEMEWLQGGDVPGVYGRKLTFGDGALFVFVSECGADVPVEVKDADTGAVYGFELKQERSVLFAADKEGRVMAVYRPDEVEIAESEGEVRA